MRGVIGCEEKKEVKLRLWSIHPKYLDVKGFLALWRETLLAKKVLQGLSKGYQNHPQLERFKRAQKPLDCVNFYLQKVWEEACERGYNFDKSKFEPVRSVPKLSVTSGQIAYEREHLLRKLAVRDVRRKDILQGEADCMVHPLFEQVKGDRESWEKV